MWTEFGASLTVWDLRTGKSIDIRDPKFCNGLDANFADEGPGWAFKPLPQDLDDGRRQRQEDHQHNRILALLSRVGSRDILSLHAPHTYQTLSTASLTSVDAKGLKWSPDGKWLAIWEAPAQGMKVWIYTADGHLFRTYSGSPGKQVEEAELGVKGIEWSPNGEWLALGGFERRVTLLNTRTVGPLLLLYSEIKYSGTDRSDKFAPLLHFDHTPQVHLPTSSPVYIETLPSVTKPGRSYQRAPQPFTLPTASSFTPPNRSAPSNPSADACLPSGISCLSFNSTGTILATLSPAHHSTVWIWDLRRLALRAVIVQTQPIKQITWAPHRANLLLIQCRAPEPIAYLWDTEGLAIAPIDTDSDVDRSVSKDPEETDVRIESPPQILDLPLEKRAPGGKSRLEATWLPRRSDQAPAFVFGDSASFIVVRPRGSDSDPASPDDEEVITSPSDALVSNGKAINGHAQAKMRSSHGSSEESRPLTPHDEDSEDSLYEILTGRTPMRVTRKQADDGDGETLAIAEMVDAEEADDDFTRMEDTFAGKKGLSFGEDSDIF